MSITRTALAEWALAPVVALSLLAAPAQAREAEVRQLRPDVYVLIGIDGNVLILPDAQGALIVDDQRSRAHNETVAAVAKVSPAPVRYVIDTHWHLDHAGDNAAFAKSGAVIIAQREVRTRLSSDQFMVAYNSRIPAQPPMAWPTLVYDDTLELHIGSETVLLRHTPAAHTDGDTIVKLVKANVIHMGDVYFNGLFPFIDTSSGGGVMGVIAAVDATLAMADDATIIVPAHGEMAKKADLQAYRDMLVDITAKVRKGIRAHKTLAEIQAGKPTAAYALEGEADRLVESIYEGLTKKG